MSEETPETDTQDPASLTFDHRDEYGRRAVAEKIQTLLAEIDDISPLVIDGPWGSGKSEFAIKLKNFLESAESGLKVAYIDAFKAERANSPLLTLTAAVSGLIEDEQKKESMLKFSISLIQSFLPIAPKVMLDTVMSLAGVSLSTEDIEQVIKESKKDQSFKSAVESHAKLEENIARLRKFLGEIASDIPMVIIVDELDRCRPDYAIDFIEDIKHLFDVKGVKFVLVTNLDQMRASIAHRYGPEIDPDRYLDKFVAFRVPLPQDVKMDRSDNYWIAATKHFFTHVSDIDGFGQADHNNEHFRGVVKRLIEANRLSLREVETLARYCRIARSLSPHDGIFAGGQKDVYRDLSFFAVFIACFRRDLAHAILNGEDVGIEMVRLLGVDRFPEDIYYEDPDIFAASLFAGYLILELNIPIEGAPSEEWIGSGANLIGHYKSGMVSLDTPLGIIRNVLRLFMLQPT